MSKIIILCVMLIISFGCILARPDKGRIVGGYSIDITNRPFQVGVLYFDQLFCGGTIVSKKTIVTAAHCVSGFSASFLSIRAGSTFHWVGGSVFEVAYKFEHPLYNPQTFDYDVAVLILTSSLSFTSNNIQPIVLATSEVSTGTMVKVSGWGVTSEGGPSSNHLLAVDLPIVSRSDCSNLLGTSITNRMICAGYSAGGKDSCQGDSGGPLNDLNNTVLYGIVSFGYGCARPNSPGVYTNIADSSVQQFIINNLVN